MIWVDYAIVGIIGISALISLWRGFIKEVLSLAAWVAAFIVARTFTDGMASLLEPHVGVPSARMVLAFGILFVLTLLAGGIINFAIGKLVSSTGLSGTDKLLGILFGVARGVLVVSILVLVAGLTPVPKDPWWRESVLLGHFQSVALWIRGFLPAEFASRIAY